MPTYAYRCQKCGEEIEVVQSMSDPPLKRCKTCRGALKRVYHPVGIVLKGSGFYKTDYGSSGSSKSRSSDSKSSDSKSSDSKSSDSKSSDTKSSDTSSKPKDK
jgi:putative FmdB family regulatory protein